MPYVARSRTLPCSAGAKARNAQQSLVLLTSATLPLLVAHLTPPRPPVHSHLSIHMLLSRRASVNNNHTPSYWRALFLESKQIFIWRATGWMQHSVAPRSRCSPYRPYQCHRYSSTAPVTSAQRSPPLQQRDSRRQRGQLSGTVRGQRCRCGPCGICMMPCWSMICTAVSEGRGVDAAAPTAAGEACGVLCATHGR